MTSLLRSAVDRIQEAAAGSIRNLSSESEDSVAGEGGLSLLIQLLRSQSESSVEQAAAALWSLSAAAGNQVKIVQEGGIYR